MDFSLGPAETEWRDRVRAFMDEMSARAAADYDAQQREGDRWKVLPVVEELKEKARDRRAVEPVHAAVARRDARR